MMIAKNAMLGTGHGSVSCGHDIAWVGQLLVGGYRCGDLFVVVRHGLD